MLKEYCSASHNIGLRLHQLRTDAIYSLKSVLNVIGVDLTEFFLLSCFNILKTRDCKHKREEKSTQYVSTAKEPLQPGHKYFSKFLGLHSDGGADLKT